MGVHFFSLIGWQLLTEKSLTFNLLIHLRKKVISVNNDHALDLEGLEGRASRAPRAVLAQRALLAGRACLAGLAGPPIAS